MDIVVTIPKSEYKNDDLETEFLNNNEDAYQFWTLSKTPKNLNINDRVFFIKNNKIDSSMKVFKIENDVENTCEVTGRVWKGCTLYMNNLINENIDIKVNGFQGFRYKWW